MGLRLLRIGVAGARGDRSPARALGAAALLFGALILSPQAAQAQFVQQGNKLTATDANGKAEQGSSVALSSDGNTMVIGGSEDNSGAGAVWVFTRSGTTWTEQAKLIGTGTTGTLPTRQGFSVALSADGNTTIIGGPLDDNTGTGAAWVFTRDGSGTWSQQGSKLVGSGFSGGPRQGTSVALSADGNTAIIGGFNDASGTGAAWVFTRSGGVWSQQGGKLVGTGGSGIPEQGGSVALSADGNTAIVGGNNDASGTGAAWVFTRSGGVWTQQGGKLVGTGAIGAANQGQSVALSADGNTAVIGGFLDNGDAGAAWIFRNSGGAWIQQGGKLVGSDASGNAAQGVSVALSADGSTALIGGQLDDSDTGAAWVFTRDTDGSWSQQGSKLVGSGAVGAAEQGLVALSADGNTAVVGAPVDDNLAGAVWAFVQPPTVTRVSAGAGPVDGGTLVGIAGSHLTGTTAVTFGGTAATDVTVIDDTFLVATTPAHAAGTVDVAVATSSLGTGTAAGAYTYIADPTATFVSSSGNPSTVAQAVTFTAFVSGSGTPTGSVTFKDGGTTLATAALSGGTATLATSALAVGAHTITASYTGFGTFAASTSAALTQTVGQGATATALSASSGSLSFGQPVTFTATVAVTAPASGTPTGSVTFKDGASTLGTASLSNGTAILSTAALAVGTHTIAAAYGGDADFAGSTASAMTEIVDKDATTTTLSAAPNPSRPGRTVTLTATVAASAPATGTPTGSIIFKDGATALGSGVLANGTASLSTAALTIGGHAITAIYDGTSTLAGSTGAATLSVDPRVGPEFRINTHTAGRQQHPEVTRLGNGFVVVWDSGGEDGSGFGIYGRRFTAAARAVGGEFRVNTTVAGNQSMPAMAPLANGGFVVAWQSRGQDGSGLGVYAQRYSRRGSKIGGEFQVNTATANDQSEPAIAALADGGFVVVWTSQGQDGSGAGVYGQRFDKTGAKLGNEFRVNTTTINDQLEPAAAVAGSSLVVAWASNAMAQFGFDLYGQEYTASGAKSGHQFRIRAAQPQDQTHAAVAALTSGFIVVWTSYAQDGSGFGIYAQRFTAAGAKLGRSFRVNTTTANDQSQPAVAALGDGFVIGWTSRGQDGSGKGVYAQAYDANNNPAYGEFRVNTTTANDQAQPHVAALGDHTFAVVWTSKNQDGSRTGIYGQRFSIPGLAAP